MGNAEVVAQTLCLWSAAHMRGLPSSKTFRYLLQLSSSKAQQLCSCNSSRTDSISKIPRGYISVGAFVHQQQQQTTNSNSNSNNINGNNSNNKTVASPKYRPFFSYLCSTAPASIDLVRLSNTPPGKGCVVNGYMTKAGNESEPHPPTSVRRPVPNVFAHHAQHVFVSSKTGVTIFELGSDLSPVKIRSYTSTESFGDTT